MFVEDASLFFADFRAASVTVGGTAVQAIFDNGYAPASLGGYGVATTQPRITLATAQVPANPVGQACVVGSAAYVVAEHQPDGTGISVLMLDAA